MEASVPKGLKVDFGPGPKARPDWINVDIRDLPGIDYVCRFWEAPFGEETIEEIYCRHALEHLTFVDAFRTLVCWKGWLKSLGKARIIVPNLAFHARQLLGEVESRHSAGEYAHAIAGFYGWQRHKDDLHLSGYTDTYLEEMLKEAGFAEVQTANRGPHLEAIAIK